MAPSGGKTAGDREFQALVLARYAGNPEAISELGARLLVGRDAPLAPVDGAALIAQAAQQGCAVAWQYVALTAAAGVGRAQSWSDVLDAVQRAAALGSETARSELVLLQALGITCAQNVRAWLAAPARELLRDSPRLVVSAGFLDPAICEHFRRRAAPRLERARVNDARGGGLKLDPMRTNSNAVFSVIETDVVMQLVRARMAALAKVELSALEPMEVLHYGVGETYRPHVDFFHPALPTFTEEMRTKGQRIRTCLVYLNDDFTGGATAFPRLDLEYRGAAGDALVFDNVGANGAGDMNTLHTGLPPSTGEKWLLSQWMRSKPQRIA
jgi:prolyl 4-hydroxylase